MTDAKIEIRPVRGLWVVRAGGAVLGETRNALEVREDGRDPVIYFPRKDMGMEFLDRSDRRSTDPAIGEATHYHIAAKSGLIRDAAWSYESPNEDAAQIAGMIAFDPERATVEQI